jgi:hypothetical protein
MAEALMLVAIAAHLVQLLWLQTEGDAVSVLIYPAFCAPRGCMGLLKPRQARLNNAIIVVLILCLEAATSIISSL